jgi:hypothetical protein
MKTRHTAVLKLILSHSVPSSSKDEILPESMQSLGHLSRDVLAEIKKKKN